MVVRRAVGSLQTANMFGRRRSAFEILLCVCAACAAEPVSGKRGGFDVASRDYASRDQAADGTSSSSSSSSSRDGNAGRAAATAERVASPTDDTGQPGAADGSDRAASRVVDAVATLDPIAEERRLRAEFAAPGDPTEPALDLAGFLCSRERFDEALALVDVARGRSADPRLRIARAGLLRDLGRRVAAANELRSLARERSAADLHPSLLLEWAELEWLNADFAAAREVLADLSRTHGADPWCIDHRAEIDVLAAAVAREQRAAKGVRDLFGDLRGGDAVAVRAAAFDGLATIGRLAGDDAAPEVLADAISIAFADVAPELRVRAVEAATPGSAIGPALLAAALGDESPRVRLAAARRAFDLDRDNAATVLLDRLAKETDAAGFEQVHASLAAVVANAPTLPSGAGETIESRATAVAAWRERCGL